DTNGDGVVDSKDKSADSSAVANTVVFKPSTMVSLGADTITPNDTQGLTTGDRVTYHVGDGGSAMGGLTDGGTYYVRVTGGSIKLYNSQSDANNNVGHIDLMTNGSGDHQELVGDGNGASSQVTGALGDFDTGNTADSND